MVSLCIWLRCKSTKNTFWKSKARNTIIYGYTFIYDIDLKEKLGQIEQNIEYRQIKDVFDVLYSTI